MTNVCLICCCVTVKYCDTGPSHTVISQVDCALQYVAEIYKKNDVFDLKRSYKMTDVIVPLSHDLFKRLFLSSNFLNNFYVVDSLTHSNAESV